MVIAGKFITLQNEGFPRIRWGEECASNTTHDRTEERGVEELFCVASITPKCFNVAYVTSNSGVTPYAGAGCKMCGEKT